MVSVHQRYGQTDRRTDVTCRQYHPMHARAVKTHITGSIERQHKVFIHARTPDNNTFADVLLRQQASGKNNGSFAVWLVRLLPDLLLCLTGSPPRLFAPKRRN